MSLAIAVLVLLLVTAVASVWWPAAEFADMLDEVSEEAERVDVWGRL